MALCEAHHKMLYEARPDVVPEGYVTPVELHLWSKYYEEQNARRKARHK
jgi:hypothetical protein